jgi:hypothetical protein
MDLQRTYHPLLLTEHARERALQRCIPHDEIDLVRRFGVPSHAAGALRLTIEGVARPSTESRWLWIRAASLVVIEARDGRILTVYRRSRGRRLPRALGPTASAPAHGVAGR